MTCGLAHTICAGSGCPGFQFGPRPRTPRRLEHLQLIITHFSLCTMSDQIKQLLDVPRDFIKDGAFFLNRCTKPSKRGTSENFERKLKIKEILEISRAVAVGFLIMGFIGFFVKLV